MFPSVSSTNESSTPNANIPGRSFLIEKIRSANRMASFWVAVQLALTAWLAILIDWQIVLREPLISTVAIGMTVGPAIMGFLRFWLQQKKEIGDLKETTRFGEFDKHNLRSLYRQTVQKLGLPDENLPVYITAEKSLNASAVRLGVLGWFKQLNGIYLNRQTLHRLEPEEVQDIIGHELGHFYRYALVNMRFTELTIVMGALIGLAVGQWIGLASYLSVIISVGCAGIFRKLDGMLWAANGPAIEYLCDDLGAQVNGVSCSITGLLKLGVDAETQQEIFRNTMAAKRAGNLSATGIFEAVERELPYGNPSKEELNKAIDRAIQKQSQKEGQLSVGGFLNYMWNSESEEDADEQAKLVLKQLDAIRAVPRLDWESCLSDPNVVRFSEHDVHHLIDMIESRPKEVLFRLPKEVGLAASDVHPALKDRILYLWYNRQEIEKASRNPNGYFNA